MRLLGMILLIVLTNSSCQKQESKMDADQKGKELSSKKNEDIGRDPALDAIRKNHEQIMAGGSGKVPVPVGDNSKQKPESLNYGMSEFLTDSFDQNVTTLAEGFKGHDAEAIFRRLQNLKVEKKVFEKGKYETKSEYETRVTEELKKNFYGNVNYESQLAILIDIQPDYDPDKKILKYLEPAYIVSDSEDRSYNSKAVSLKRNDKIVDHDMRSNSFGVQVRVTTKVISNIELVMYGNKIPASFEIKGGISMPITEAKKLDQHKIALLIYGKLRKPYYTRGSSTSEATISDPNEKITWNEYLHFDTRGIWLIDRTTGKILTKNVSILRSKY